MGGDAPAGGRRPVREGGRSADGGEKRREEEGGRGQGATRHGRGSGSGWWCFCRLRVLYLSVVARRKEPSALELRQAHREQNMTF